MPSYSVESILALIEPGCSVQGNPAGKSINSIKTIGAADEQSMAWIDPARADKQQLLDDTRAGLVIADRSLSISVGAQQHLVLVGVDAPKLTVIRLAAQLFERRPGPGIHASSVIHADARIEEDVHIGPLCCIGAAQIGAGSVIHGSVHIYDNVRIGRNVVIQAGCVIGVAGFSLARDAEGVFHNFPHMGGVVIEDDVEIQALTVVDRGVLDDTVIGQGTKINSSCYIGHNSRIGRYNFIAGNTMVSGSVRTGDHCWFAPGALVRDQLRIGAHAFVGTGSVVVASLDEHARVMGNPAKDIDEAKALSQGLKRLVDADSTNAK